jgi:hypothetical protein
MPSIPPDGVSEDVYRKAEALLALRRRVLRDYEEQAERQAERQEEPVSYGETGRNPYLELVIGRMEQDWERTRLHPALLAHYLWLREELAAQNARDQADLGVWEHELEQ